jgi:hypothetical protein
MCPENGFGGRKGLAEACLSQAGLTGKFVDIWLRCNVATDSTTRWKRMLSQRTENEENKGLTAKKETWSQEKR